MQLLRFPIVVILLITSSLCAQELDTYTRAEKLMGKAFQIVVVHQDSSKAKLALDRAVAEIKSTEKNISSWTKESETTLINNNAGIKPTKVSDDLFNLIKRSKVYSSISNGAFDISIQPLINLWNEFLSQNQLPDSASVKSILQLVDFKKIILDSSKNEIYLSENNMKISFGAVGKGYAAERTKALLKNMGVNSGLVNAGGDICAWGNQSNGKPWEIAIQHPRDENKLIAWLEIKDQSIVTSGDYEAFKIINGKRYSHILDPKSGYPVNSLYSTTVIAYNAELADAMATAIFVLGPDKGLQLAEQIKGLEAILFTSNDEILSTSGLDLSWEKQ